MSVFSIGTNDSSPHICGICGRRFALAVFDRSKGRLRLLASGLSQYYGGHRDAELDLAPYRLNDKETLVGLRVNHTWMMVGTFNTRLELYRMVGDKLLLVFRATVVERQYPEGVTGSALNKMVQKVDVEKATPFNNLWLDGRVVHCRKNSDFDCDTDAKGSVTVWHDRSEWIFNGSRYARRDLDSYFDSGGN